MQENIDLSKYGLNEVQQNNTNNDLSKYGLTEENISNSNNNKNNEDILSSLSDAPFKIGEDILNAGLKFAGDIPKYYKKSKTEIPGIFNLLKNHPFNALRQSAAGITELGHNLLNTPRGLSEYIENRLNLLPEGFSKYIPMQKDISEDINNTFGKVQYPGEELMRGLSRNSLLIGSGSKILPEFNPLKYTYKNIAKDVSKTGEKMRLKYQKKYNDIFSDAKKQNFYDMNNFDPNKIDIQSIELHANPKYLNKTFEFIKNPNSESAHWAKSDLGKYINYMEGKPSLVSTEQKSLKAAKEAKKYLEDNMFKDKFGNINEDLLSRYKNITSGYEKERIPYSKNKALKAYNKGELSEKELVPKLSKGKFSAKRGEDHPEINRRMVINHLLPKLGIGGGLLFGAKTIYDAITGKNK